MLNRRELFRLLTGAALSPALEPLAVLVPTKTISYRTYLIGSENIASSRALTASDIRNCAAWLRGANVRPHPDTNNYSFIVHPDHAHFMEDIL